MLIYIVRHGIAEDQSANGTDEARQLTEEGQTKMKEVVTGLNQLEAEIDLIYSSPLIRARQTAEILAKEFRKKVEEMKELAPGHSSSQVCEKLQALNKQNKPVALVGHEPNCSYLMSYLLDASEEMKIEFKKGGIALVDSPDLEPGTATLIYHFPPRILRLLNRR